MASGYGMSGGVSRCFPFWQELLACYVVNTSSDDVSGQKKCVPQLEDYYECLHHRKELAKARAMQHEMAKRFINNELKDDRPSAGEIRQLGLIPNQKPQDVNMNPPKYIPHKKPGIS